MRARLCRLVLLACALAAGAAPALAEVERTARAGPDGISLSWWPRLPGLPGWVRDPLKSEQYAASTLVPEAAGAVGTSAVIYAKAQYKPRAPELRVLNDLITRDRNAAVEDGGGVRPSPGLVSGNGRPLVCLEFESAVGDSWMRACYLEEGDYYLVFALNARERDDYARAMKDFETLVARYRE